MCTVVPLSVQWSPVCTEVPHVYSGPPPPPRVYSGPPCVQWSPPPPPPVCTVVPRVYSGPPVCTEVPHVYSGPPCVQWSPPPPPPRVYSGPPCVQWSPVCTVVPRVYRGPCVWSHFAVFDLNTCTQHKKHVCTTLKPSASQVLPRNYILHTWLCIPVITSILCRLTNSNSSY